MLTQSSAYYDLTLINGVDPVDESRQHVEE